MLNIAVCDDDIIFCTELETLLYAISKELNLAISIDLYYDALKFKKKIQIKRDYDLIFLDIEFNNILGSEIGCYIRNDLNWENVGIIYISNHSKYALSLFKTRPHDFMIKPITHDKMKDTFETFVQLYQKKNKYYEYKSGSSYYRINTNNILYFESDNKIIKIHCEDKIITFYGKLNDVSQELNDTFLSIHKSYLVNCEKILNIRYEEIVLINDEVLPISQSKRQDVKKFFMRKWVKAKS